MTIIEDNRPIQTIDVDYSGCPIENLAGWSVGQQVNKKNNISKISAVYENGEMAYVVWFEIWCGDFLFFRVNGKYVRAIWYKDS